MADPILTAEYVRAELDYNPETGELRRRSTGRVITATNTGGYRIVKLAGKTRLVHRVIWLHVHGRLPEHAVDHINRVRADNRLANLRDVSHFENMQNKGANRSNPSSHPGVSWCHRTKTWQVAIRKDYKLNWIGRFAELTLAVAARKAAEAQYFGRLA